MKCSKKLSLLKQLVCFFLRLDYSKFHHFGELIMELARHYYTHTTWTVDFLTHKHGAKCMKKQTCVILSHPNYSMITDFSMYDM